MSPCSCLCIIYVLLCLPALCLCIICVLLCLPALCLCITYILLCLPVSVLAFCPVSLQYLCSVMSPHSCVSMLVFVSLPLCPLCLSVPFSLRCALRADGCGLYLRDILCEQEYSTRCRFLGPRCVSGERLLFPTPSHWHSGKVVLLR